MDLLHLDKIQNINLPKNPKNAKNNPNVTTIANHIGIELEKNIEDEEYTRQ